MQFFFSGLILNACDNKNEETDNNKPVITIGATLPLSGDSAVAGVASKAALEMVLQDLQKSGLKYDYHLVFENNDGSQMKTATTAQKLISVNKAKAVFSLWNVMGSVVASIANPKEVINMTCSWEEPSLIGPYTFNAISTNEQIAAKLVDELQKEGIKSVAILVDNSGEMIIKQVEKKLKTAGIKIVFNEISNMGNNDYKMAVIKARQNNPDKYIIIGVPPMPYIFVKQLAEITGRKNVTGVDGFMEMTEDQRSIADGLWYIDSNVNGTKEFAKRLKEIKQVETQSCAGNLAANLQILINAFENVPLKDGQKVPDNQEVVEYIRKNVKDFPTVSGAATLIRDNIVNIKPLKRMIKNGKVVDFE